MEVEVCGIEADWAKFKTSIISEFSAFEGYTETLMITIT